MSNNWDQPDELVERVMVGVEYMDATRANWRELVDPTFLDMSKPSLCIIGQVFGNYYQWRDGDIGREDCIEFEDEVAMGFNLDIFFEPYTFEQLRDVWLHVLAGDEL